MEILDNNFKDYFNVTTNNSLQDKPVDEPQDSIFVYNNNKNAGFNSEENKNFAAIDVFGDYEKGVTFYKYNDAHYSIYKDDDGIKSEFYCPSDVDEGEFFDQIDSLVPQQPVVAPFQVKDNPLGINGEFDEMVIQGGTGDCWIISALKSLSSTQAGRDAIKNSIQVNEDNSVTVSFSGVGVSYTLSPEEILKYDTDFNINDAYSNGDNDVLAFELATEKLWQDIASGKVRVDDPNRLSVGVDAKAGIDAGSLPSQFIYYLTGQKTYEYLQTSGGKIQDLSHEAIFQILENAKNDKNAVLTFGVYDNIHAGKLTNGDRYYLDVGNGGHALSVTNVGDNTITFVNPWDTSVEYTMSWDEFAKFGIGYMSYTQVAPNPDVQLDLPNENHTTFYSAPNHFKEDMHSYRNNLNSYENSANSDEVDLDFLDFEELQPKEGENKPNKFSYLYNLILKLRNRFDVDSPLLKAIFAKFFSNV